MNTYISLTWNRTNARARHTRHTYTEYPCTRAHTKRWGASSIAPDFSFMVIRLAPHISPHRARHAPKPSQDTRARRDIACMLYACIYIYAGILCIKALHVPFVRVATATTTSTMKTTARPASYTVSREFAVHDSALARIRPLFLIGCN